MDPQRLLFLDKRIVRTIRTTGLIFSVSLALICLLVYFGVFEIRQAFLWACLPLAGALTILGMLEAFWNPYTQPKVSAYVTTYMVIGAPLSVLVLGFSTMIFMGWTLLIMVTVIFFGIRRAAVGYGLMVASLFTWLTIHAADHTRADVLAYGFSALAVGILCLLVMNVWRLANDSVHSMEEAHEKQDLEHSQLTSLINSMADGVIAVDATTKIILYNAAALNLLDINSSMQGKEVHDFVHITNEKGEDVDLKALILATKTPAVNRDYSVQYADGSGANLYLSIAPVHLGYGKGGEHGFVLILRDITREKSLEEERDEFISVVSHELRTPIAITEGEISNAQLMAEKSKSSDAIKNALDEAHNQVLFLADMINDLSTLSRAERGVLKLETEDIVVSDLLKELDSNYQKQANEKGLKLAAHLPKEKLVLHSSKLYVREVLQNFITNSIKYTQKGTVTFTAKAHGTDGVEFSVNDTGIGISKQDQKRVFEKFFRSEDFRTRATNGTGLGLYVTSKLIKLLDAEVTVESQLNKGSMFTVVVPNRKLESPSSEK
jgi:PAS domain S-box-containing protein